METGTTIIGIVLIALCILPFIIAGYISKKRKNKILKSLREFAEKHNCNISKYDTEGQLTIGVDETNKCIFFCKKNIDKQLVNQYVDLKDILNCMILINNNPLKFREGNFGSVDKLELCFTAADRNKSDIKFEFFNSETDIRLTTEMQMAEKWMKLVNEMIKIKIK